MGRVLPVSQPTPDQDRQRFVLRAQTPLRALVIASGSEVIGAILLVGWDALDLPVVVVVLAALLLAFGSAVLLAAVLAFGRLAQTVEVGPSGVTLHTRSRDATTLAWADVKQVTLNGDRLVLKTASEDQAMAVRNPGGGADRTFAAMTEAIRARLDADRGYRPFA